ncbi:MAG: hypothetical protein LBM78_01485, partial [Clostridiales bacterium]|nr:hypothetical protein [Clostridiales bacterium]
MTKTPFKLAGVWPEGYADTMNVTAAFTLDLAFTGTARLRIAAGQVYRLFVGGKLAGYGPARAAAGYVRLDGYNLRLSGDTRIVVEVASYRINSYYLMNAAPFFAVHLTAGERTYTAADFTAHIVTDRVRKVQRFSFQRCFTEVYNQHADKAAFYRGDVSPYSAVPVVSAEVPAVLPRGVGYPRFRGINARLFERGVFSPDGTGEVWNDRLFDISDKLLGYKREELESRLTDPLYSYRYTKTDGVRKPLKTVAVLKAGGYTVSELPQTKTGFLRLNAEVETDSEIVLLFDEILWEEEKNLRYENGAANVSFYRNACSQAIKWTLSQGSYELLTFEPYTAKYIKVLCTKGSAHVSGVGIVTYENADAHTKLKIPDTV